MNVLQAIQEDARRRQALAPTGAIPLGAPGGPSGGSVLPGVTPFPNSNPQLSTGQDPQFQARYQGTDPTFWNISNAVAPVLGHSGNTFGAGLQPGGLSSLMMAYPWLQRFRSAGSTY